MVQSDSIRHRGLKELYTKGATRRVKPDHVKRIRLLFAILDAMEDVAVTAKTQTHLKLHKLTGDLAGHWAIKVSGPWRLTFRFANGNVEDLNYTQYH